MSNKQKKLFWRIITAAALLILLGLGKKIEDLDDPKGLCQDKPHGPGSPTRVDLTNAGQLSDVLDLLAQC